MDVIVCNGFGAYLGMKTCEYLGNKVSSFTMQSNFKLGGVARMVLRSLLVPPRC